VHPSRTNQAVAVLFPLPIFIGQEVARVVHRDTKKISALVDRQGQIALRQVLSLNFARSSAFEVDPPSEPMPVERATALLVVRKGPGRQRRRRGWRGSRPGRVPSRHCVEHPGHVEMVVRRTSCSAGVEAAIRAAPATDLLRGLTGAVSLGDQPRLALQCV
jgi:hypothetical protein